MQRSVGFMTRKKRKFRGGKSLLKGWEVGKRLHLQRRITKKGDIEEGWKLRSSGGRICLNEKSIFSIRENCALLQIFQYLWTLLQMFYHFIAQTELVICHVICSLDYLLYFCNIAFSELFNVNFHVHF